MTYLLLIATLCANSYKHDECRKSYMDCVTRHQFDAMVAKQPVPTKEEASADCMVGLGMEKPK